MEGICNQIVLDPDSLADAQPKKFLFTRKTQSLTQYQIEVITNVLDALEEYFHQNGEGLKKQFFKKDSAMKQLKFTLDRFSESTPSLIRRFMESDRQNSKDESREIKPAIVINYEISIVRTGRKNFTMKLRAISTENLPIEVHLRNSHIKFIMTLLMRKSKTFYYKGQLINDVLSLRFAYQVLW